MTARVKITAPHRHAKGTEVLVDGVKVERLAGLEVSIGVGEPTPCGCTGSPACRTSTSKFRSASAAR